MRFRSLNSSFTLYQLFLLFLFFHLSGLTVYCQPNMQWQHCYGGTKYERPYDIKATPDGGCIAIGNSLSSNFDVSANFGVNDFWIVKLDSLGGLEWETNLGGSADDGGYTIYVTEDHEYLAAGFTESTDVQVTGNHGEKDCWIVKLDSEGSVLWRKCYGGSKSEIIYGIAQTSDGGFVFASESVSSDGDLPGNLGGADFWIFKIDHLGNVVWSKVYGGSNLDTPNRVEIGPDNYIYVIGQTNSNDGDISFSNGGLDIWLLKLDQAGNLVWQNTLGGSNYDFGTDLVFSSNGKLVISGCVYSSNGDVTDNNGGMDFWLAELNDQGNVIWQKAFGGSGDDAALSIEVMGNSGFLIFGDTQSNNGDVVGNDGGQDFWLVRVSNTGELMWQKTYGGTLDESGYGIARLKDGGVALAGRTRSNNGDVSGNHGSSDFWIVKLSPETSATTTPSAIPLNLYPNPAQNWFRLNLPITEPEMQISITDAQGRVVLAKTIRSDERLDVAALEPGVYGVSALAQSGQVYAGKLVKE
jgi:hypothetical protein